MIKPALIGLIGAWISGGIEWNIRTITGPRPSCRSSTGSRTAPTAAARCGWGNWSLRHRMRWAVGYTLRPGSSVVEAKLRIVNRTSLPHTLLCFANVAVHVNKSTRSSSRRGRSS